MAFGAHLRDNVFWPQYVVAHCASGGAFSKGEVDPMIRFRDFVPKMLAEPGLFKAGEYESMEDAVAAANDWIKQNEIQVTNIETVVLPNIWSRWEEGSADTALGTSGDSPSRWHQIVRVWYET